MRGHRCAWLCLAGVGQRPASRQIQAWALSKLLCSDAATAPPPHPVSQHRWGPDASRRQCPAMLRAGSKCGGDAREEELLRTATAQRSRPLSSSSPHPSTQALADGPHGTRPHLNTSPGLLPYPVSPPASQPPRWDPSLTAVHAEVALRADGLDEAVRPAAKGRGEPCPGSSPQRALPSVPSC